MIKWHILIRRKGICLNFITTKYDSNYHRPEDLQNRVRQAHAVITPKIVRKVHLETVNRTSNNALYTKFSIT